MLSKKRLAPVAMVLTVVLFVPFFLYLPIEIAAHRPGNVPLLVINAGFAAVTASLFIVICLILLTKRDFVRRHLLTFHRFRHLLVLMVKRDFVTRYRRSVLGVLWSVLNPVLTMLILTMVFSQLFGFHIPYYSFPVYLFSGQLIFNFFNESTTSAMNSVVLSGGIIKKVYVPKYIFPISRVLSSMVNVFFSFIAFLVVFIIMGETFNWTFFLIPIPIILTLAFSLGVGMILSSLAVFFRDLTYIYGIGTQLLFFLTPIMYHPDILPERVYFLIHLNPLFHYVSYFRSLALAGTLPSLWTNIMCIGFALLALSLGLFTTVSQQDKYILHL